MDQPETQQAHVRFSEPFQSQGSTPLEKFGCVDPGNESESNEAGWLLKPIVRDLLEHEMAVAIQTVFVPHLSSIESEAMQLFSFCNNVKDQIQEEQQALEERLGQLAGIVTQFQGQVSGLQSFLGMQTQSAINQAADSA
ncbi:hypothetical protein WJX74_001450 [Apatococcus lobatus]|uniref:Uncharacterized protein n=2 Tax=Apatococcus TaxID=904362 RepID=A0AAW1SYZ0_9CHLO